MPFALGGFPRSSRGILGSIRSESLDSEANGAAMFEAVCGEVGRGTLRAVRGARAHAVVYDGGFWGRLRSVAVAVGQGTATRIFILEGTVEMTQRVFGRAVRTTETDRVRHGRRLGSAEQKEKNRLAAHKRRRRRRVSDLRTIWREVGRELARERDGAHAQ